MPNVGDFLENHGGLFVKDYDDYRLIVSHEDISVPTSDDVTFGTPDIFEQYGYSPYLNELNTATAYNTAQNHRYEVFSRFNELLAAFGGWDLPTKQELWNILDLNVYQGGSEDSADSYSLNILMEGPQPGDAQEYLRRWYWTKTEGDSKFQSLHYDPIYSQVSENSLNDHLDIRDPEETIVIRGIRRQFYSQGGTSTHQKVKTAEVWKNGIHRVSNGNPENTTNKNIYLRVVRRIPIEDKDNDTSLPPPPTTKLTFLETGEEARTSGFGGTLPSTNYITSMVANNKGFGTTTPQSLNFLGLGMNLNPAIPDLRFAGGSWRSPLPTETLPCNGLGAQQCSLLNRVRQMWELKKTDNSNIAPKNDFASAVDSDGNPLYFFNKPGDFYSVEIGNLFDQSQDHRVVNVFASPTLGPFKFSDFRGVGHWGTRVRMRSYEGFKHSISIPSVYSTLATYELGYGLQVSTNPNSPIHLGGAPSITTGNSIIESDTIIDLNIDDASNYPPNIFKPTWFGHTTELIDYKDPEVVLNTLWARHIDLENINETLD